MARRVRQAELKDEEVGPTAGRTVIFGFGRVGRMVADMMTEHDRPYLAVDSDIDSFAEARKAGYAVLYGDVSRKELIEKLQLNQVAAVVLTMDDPVLTARLAKRLSGRASCSPDHRPRPRHRTMPPRSTAPG